MNAPNKFVQRTNQGFADATCNLVTGVMLPLEPNRYSNCAQGARTVPFGHSSGKPDWTRSLRKAAKTIGSALFCWASSAFARLRRGQSYEYFMWVQPCSQRLTAQRRFSWGHGWRAECRRHEHERRYHLGEKPAQRLY
jgi:hypothetical protein